MKKIILIILIALIVLINTPLKVRGDDTTDSAVSDEEVDKALKERIEKERNKDLEKVKGDIEKELNSQVYAWIGTVEKVEEETITIKTNEGERETKVATNAAIFKVNPGKGKNEIETDDIKTSQFIIAMGFKNQEEVILGKRLIITEEIPPSVKRDIITGKVKEVDEDKVTLQKNGETVTLTIDKKTKLKINGIKKPSADDIQINDYLTAIVAIDEEENIESIKTVLIAPGESNPQAEENDVTLDEVKESSPAAETTQP